MDPTLLILAVIGLSGVVASAYSLRHQTAGRMVEERTEHSTSASGVVYEELKSRLEKAGLREDSHGVFVGRRTRA